MSLLVKRKILVFFGFLVIGLTIYAPAIKGPFQFDDKRVILDKSVREDRDTWGFGSGILGSRGLVSASFLANWKWWGEEAVGYHLVNILIHVTVSFLVFELVGIVVDKKKDRFWLSVLGGMLFLVHPLQTQAVAYISQRFVSMMAMFYLLSVVLYLKARKNKWSWGYGLAWLAGLAANSSKEVAITLPIMIVLMDLVMFKKRDIKQWLIMGIFLLLMLKIPVQMVLGENKGRGISSVAEIGPMVSVVEKDGPLLTRKNYLLTQFNVLRIYMRLLILPVRQSIDYDYGLKTEVDLETVISLGMLLGVLGVGVWGFKTKQKWLFLAMAWFFVPLSVTSSIVPIRDMVYEHRMYLSLVGFVLLIAGLMQKYKRIRVYGLWIVVLFAVMTFSRNRVWGSELKLWADAWQKAPEKARTNKNYGFVLTQEGKLAKGIERLEYAVTLKNDDQHYFITLGSAYLQANNWQKAKIAFERAVELEPLKEDGWNNLGVALFQLKRYRESKSAFEKSIELSEDFYMAWLGLGGAEMFLGNIKASEKALEKTISLDPQASQAYSNLVTLYVRTKDWPKAWEAVVRWETVDPSGELVRLKKQAILEKLR